MTESAVNIDFNEHNNLTELAQALHGKFNKTYEAGVVTLGIILTDIFAHQGASLKAGSDLVEHAVKGATSTLVPDDVSTPLLGSSDPVLDAVVDVAEVSAASILARQTTSSKNLIKLAVAAQTAATATDAAMMKAGMLSRTELHSLDDGTSALPVAYTTKWLFDKFAQTENEKMRKAILATVAVFAGAVTVLAAKLDPTHFHDNIGSHGGAALTGAVASKLEQRSKSKNSAPEAVEA